MRTRVNLPNDCQQRLNPFSSVEELLEKAQRTNETALQLLSQNSSPKLKSEAEVIMKENIKKIEQMTKDKIDSKENSLLLKLIDAFKYACNNLKLLATISFSLLIVVSVVIILK